MFRFLVFLGSWRKTFATAVGVSSIFTSVLFTLVAITLTFLTQHGNELACEAAILTCDFLYTGAKAQLYIFFIERIYIVHKTPTQTRSTSPLYIFNVCLLIPYCGILVLMVLYRVAYVDHNNVCRIGLRNEGALPLLIYDSIFSMYSIAMFVWPLYTMRNKSTYVIDVTKRNTVGSIVSTMSSFMNIFSIYYQNRATAEICFWYCTMDVTINVLVMNYLINGGGSNSPKTSDSFVTVDKKSQHFAVPLRDRNTLDARTDMTGRTTKVELTTGRSVKVDLPTGRTVKVVNLEEKIQSEEMALNSIC